MILNESHLIINGSHNDEKLDEDQEYVEFFFLKKIFSLYECFILL
jgi:hypothetical protein